MQPSLGQGKAPGRLDFLGGVADYSGSLVLQMPTQATTRVIIAAHSQPSFQIGSHADFALRVMLPLAELRDLAQPRVELSAVRAWLDERAVPSWTRYIAGCFLLFCRAAAWWPAHGLKLCVESEVPISMGAASSAALEVATLRALEAMSGHTLRGTALAHLAQRAENEIVGAPCGLMDQLASAYGAAGQLLPILCHPDELGAPVRLPESTLVVGWPSGVKHAVADSPYLAARTAAFMGKKIIERRRQRPLCHLTEIAPPQLQMVSLSDLPATLRGDTFLSAHGGVDDALSRVIAERDYAVRAGVTFPIEENFRCQLAVQLLRQATLLTREEVLRAVGELMYQSHAGYGALGLGCIETDAMVEAVRELGPAHGFYGARISGGGSGGTVVVLLDAGALPQLRQLQKRHASGAGLPLLLSSPAPI